MIAGTQEPFPPAFVAPRLRVGHVGLGELRQRARREFDGALIGHEQSVELALVAALTGGHVLVEGPPGIAKTLLAEAVARLLGVNFDRLQFTEETTTPAILGMNGARINDPTFLPGPIFTNVFLAEDFDLSSSPTQLAVLDAMQGRNVSFAGRTHWLPAPFMVIATVGSHAFAGVAPLPITGRDRFLVRIKLDYLPAELERKIVQLPHHTLVPDVLSDIQPLMDSACLLDAHAKVAATVAGAPEVALAVEIVRRTREVDGVLLGGSPRAALHLLNAAKARAQLDGRSEVSAADVVELAPHVLAHRLVVEGVDPFEVVRMSVASATA